MFPAPIGLGLQSGYVTFTWIEYQMTIMPENLHMGNDRLQILNPNQDAGAVKA